MKAGAFTPAIQASLITVAAEAPRSMKAGAFTPAIPVMVASLLVPSVAQ